MIVRKPFSEAEDAYIIANAYAGPQAIRKALGRDYKSVRDRMVRMGLPIIVRARIAWTPEVDEQIRALSAERLSDSAIAERLGCSEEGVRQRRWVLGVAKPPKPKNNSPRARKRRRADARDETRAPTLLTVREATQEERFLDRLLRDGGLPRAEIVNGRTVWIGADNRPWFDPDRRRAA